MPVVVTRLVGRPGWSVDPVGRGHPVVVTRLSIWPAIYWASAALSFPPNELWLSCNLAETLRETQIEPETPKCQARGPARKVP